MAASMRRWRSRVIASRARSARPPKPSCHSRRGGSGIAPPAIGRLTICCAVKPTSRSAASAWLGTAVSEATASTISRASSVSAMCSASPIANVCSPVRANTSGGSTRSRSAASSATSSKLPYSLPHDLSQVFRSDSVPATSMSSSTRRGENASRTASSVVSQLSSRRCCVRRWASSDAAAVSAGSSVDSPGQPASMAAISSPAIGAANGRRRTTFRRAIMGLIRMGGVMIRRNDRSRAGDRGGRGEPRCWEGREPRRAFGVVEPEVV